MSEQNKIYDEWLNSTVEERFIFLSLLDKIYRGNGGIGAGLFNVQRSFVKKIKEKGQNENTS